MRLPVVFGILDLNKGKVLFTGAVAPEFHDVLLPPKSQPSQLYVSASPSGSVAEPVKVKGVLTGIVIPPTRGFIMGILLPVGVDIPQLLPFPVVIKLLISSKLIA